MRRVCVFLTMVMALTTSAWTMTVTLDESFERSYGGEPVSNGLLMPSGGSLPAPTAFSSPNQDRVYPIGSWDASHWVEWSAANTPFSGGSYSLNWKSNSATPSSGNQTRIYTQTPSNADTYADGVQLSFDFYTNDNNPGFVFALGHYQNYIFEAGTITGTFNYVARDWQRTQLCTFELSTWYRVQISIHQNPATIGYITFNISKWVNGAPVTVVKDKTITYTPFVGTVNTGSYEYGATYCDGVYADGTSIPGGVGITRLDNLVMRASSTPILPALLLKTNANGLYSEAIGDLDLLTCHFVQPPDRPTPPGDAFNPPMVSSKPGDVCYGASVRALEPFETTFDGATPTSGLHVSSAGTTPMPTAYVEPVPTKAYVGGSWDSTHWVEWDAMNAPVTPGTFSMTWKSTAQTASGGNQNRIGGYYSAGSVDPFAFGADVSFDFWTNDDNPRFLVALGSYQNYIFEAGGLTGQVCYVGNNFQRSFLCNYECSTWYHVDIRVHQALTQTGTITYTIRRWTGSAMETIVDHVTVAYLPWANATNDGSYEYSSNCNDALLASGTVIAGNTGISRLDNFSLRSLAPPRIGVFTPQANPDRGVLLQGDLFTSQLGIDAGKDTGVWAYQQSTASNGVLYQPNILRAADQALATALDAGAPYGMCLLWAQNAAGAGYPVRVNGTDAWWIGPNHAGTEATVNVYGRNLSWNNGTTTSYVYIRPWGAGSESTSTVCDVTEVNPYKVSFTIPVLSAGDYEVWIHNGHGGIYGWSGPLKFTVDAGPRYVWNGTTHNVRLAPYNAVGNGVADDLPAIQAAINAASSGDRIYLPAGAYRISNRLYVSWKSLSFEGDGATQTTLYADNAYTATGMLYFHHGAAPARVINMKFDSASQTAMNMIWTDWYGGNPTPEGVIVDSCAFTSIPDVYDVGACIAWCKDVRVTNCTATGPSIAFLYMVHQGFVHGNDYLGNGRVYGPTAYAGFSSLQCDYSDNTAASVNRQTLRQAVKRFFVGSSNWGLLRNLYCGDSSSLECGPLPEDADQNGGENVCIETDQAHYSGSPIAVTATTLTFAGVNWTPNSFNADAPMTLGVMDGSLVYVHKGPGIGQWRRIIGNTANTITVDRPWDVPLDTSSIIAISEAGCQMAIYSNTLDGVYDDDGDEIPDYIERPSMSTCGVSFFTNNQDVVTADNDITHERYGIGLYGFTNPVDPSNNWGAQSNNLVVGNTITDGYDGLMASSIVAPSGAGETSLGPVILNNVFRDNQITNMSCEGIWIDRNYSNYFWDLPWAQHNLFEHNTLVDCATGVTFGSQQAYNLLRNNTFTRNILGSMAGVYFDAYNDSPYLYCNVYGAGVSPIYAGSPLGSGQQYNKRALVFEGIVGGTPPGEQTITLTNVGTSVLSMSAPVSDAAWLSADFSPSTVNPEQGGTLTVSVDPAGLLVGTYTGALTLYGGTLYSPQTVSATLILHSPTATNSNPTVSITAPTNGFSYAAPATINITANATDSDGTISKVEFYNNGILLGTDTSSAGGWTYSWTNVEASGASGISLTAKAYDNYNASTTSSAITGTVTDTALKCYWKLDSTSGTSCTDSSGTGNTGTTYSSPTWVAGKVLNCLNFNGTTQYAADTSTTGLPALGADQTLCCWIYVSSNPTVRKTALNTSYSTTYGNNIGFLSSTTFGVWRQGGTAIVTTTSLPTAGYWHHVAYVKSGSNKYLYIDGAQAATSTATTNTSSCTRIYVGRTASGADYWPGKVDEVRVYNRVLTLAEIQSLAAGKQ